MITPTNLVVVAQMLARRFKAVPPVIYVYIYIHECIYDTYMYVLGAPKLPAGGLLHGVNLACEVGILETLRLLWYLGWPLS